MIIQILRSAIYAGSWMWQMVGPSGVVMGTSQQRWAAIEQAEAAVEELMVHVRADVTVQRVEPDGSWIEIAEYAAEGAKDRV